MVEMIKPIAQWCAATIEMLGIFILVAISLQAIFIGVIRLIKREKTETVFHQVRQRLGQGTLLGLEFLVAADIIHTVAVELSFNTVGVLAIIVLIRTFLSFTLEVELTRRWPWQKKVQDTPRHEGMRESRG